MKIKIGKFVIEVTIVKENLFIEDGKGRIPPQEKLIKKFLKKKKIDADFYQDHKVIVIKTIMEEHEKKFGYKSKLALTKNFLDNYWRD